MEWKKIKNTNTELNYYKKNKHKTYSLNMKFYPIANKWIVCLYVWDSFMSSGIEYTLLNKREEFEEKEIALRYLSALKKIKI